LNVCVVFWYGFYDGCFMMMVLDDEFLMRDVLI
jgi:hypothetical protein